MYQLVSYSKRLIEQRQNCASRPERNENGFVLVLSLVLLVVISLMAVFATSISNIEVQTSTNNEKFQTAFLLGEGVAVEAVGLLNLEEYDDLVAHNPQKAPAIYSDWLGVHPDGDLGDGTQPDLTNPANWAGAEFSNTGLDYLMDRGGLWPPGFASPPAGTDRLQFAVQDAGSAYGFDESVMDVREYYLYGLYDVGRNSAFPGRNVFEMGFRKLLEVPESL